MSSNTPTAIVSEIDEMISLLETSVAADSASPSQPASARPQKSKPAPKSRAVVEEKKEEESSSERRPGTEPNDKSMDLSKRVAIALSVGEEVIKEEELRTLFDKKLTRPIAYDGFEPSGRMHIAQGVLKAINVNKLTSVGCDFVFWVADWFALLNKKMGGDLDKIRIVGEYMIEVWRATGMDMSHVYFRWASDDINANSNEYWLRVIEISKLFTITRTKRCCQILGRTENDGKDMPTANLMYACMQCADIFFLKADICQLGMDQRKVNMLAREYAEKKAAKGDGQGKKKKKKGKGETIYPPVVISHHMLMGLKEGQEKMSKSDPDSAIFMEDSEDDVRRKIKKAYGPPGVVKGNPLLDYTKHLVFPKYGEFTVERSEKHGGNLVYATYEELEKDYISGQLHPGDLKPALANAINRMIHPVRQHFKNDKRAKKLLAQVKKFRVTR